MFAVKGDPALICTRNAVLSLQEGGNAIHLGHFFFSNDHKLTCSI